MADLTNLKFFATPSHSCSYLADRQATTLFADPDAIIGTDQYTALSAAGFRRSGAHIYKPYCETCSACVAIRIPVTKFKVGKRHRRIIKNNADIQFTAEKPTLTEEHYQLYAQYINTRHADGDMYPPTEAQFESFLVDGRDEALFYNFRKDEKLIAVAVVDQLDDGLSAIYTYFDPSESKRSLGNFAVLTLIAEARNCELKYLYLGYWIKNCQKMSYKIEFRPTEALLDRRWHYIDVDTEL